MALSLGCGSVDEAAAELGSLTKARPPTGFREAMKLLGTALDLRHVPNPNPSIPALCKDVIHKFDAPATRTRAVAGCPLRYPVRARRSALRSHRIAAQPFSICPSKNAGPLDGGSVSITLPCVVTRDPDTGDRNLGMYRIQIYDSQTTGMHWQLQKVAARHGRRYYETGQRMPVAIFLGGDPIFTFCATAPLPDGLDEFLLAGYLLCKKSVELVKCETNDLEVPANGAISSFEGFIDPKVKPLRMEAPHSGDHTGYYTLPDPYPRLPHHRHHPSCKDKPFTPGHDCRDSAHAEDFAIGGAGRQTLPAHSKNEFPRRLWISPCLPKAFSITSSSSASRKPTSYAGPSKSCTASGAHGAG